MIINFDPAIWSVIVAAASGIAIGIEPFKKLYLDKMMAEFTWYKDLRPFIIRGCAFAVAMIMILSSDSLSFLGALSLAPKNNLAEIADIAITALLLTFSEEFLHTIGDIVRMMAATKNSELRHKVKMQENGNQNA